MQRNYKEEDAKHWFTFEHGVHVTLRGRRSSDGRIWRFILEFKTELGRQRSPLPLSAPAKMKGRRFTSIEKFQRDEALRLASIERAKREIEYQAGQIGVTSSVTLDRSFLEYMSGLGSNLSKSTDLFYKRVAEYLGSYAGGDVKFRDITKPFLLKFAEALGNIKGFGGVKLTASTQVIYLSKLKRALKLAHKSDLLSKDYSIYITMPKARSKGKEWLTMAEIRKMEEATKTDTSVIRRAFFFSCFTGLRYSDVQALKWENVHTDQEGRTWVNIIVQKTQSPLSIPLMQEAIKWMGERPENERSKVFPYFPTAIRVNKWIKSSASRSGIKKSLSFHCARHTFGMYLANNGVSLVTIKELMGHSDIKTTQIYSRASQETKAQTIQEMDELDE